jgi:uncharacterized protein YndB with AHSA1/START domain
MGANYRLTLPSDTEIVMEREFDAPPALVFRAYTEPELLVQWWGLREARTVIDRNELRPGGQWRWVIVMPDGIDVPFRGEYLAVEPPNRLSFTFEWEGLPGHISETRLELVEIPGGTRLISTSSFANQADRDAMAASGMESGALESWERLDGLLISLH